MDSQAGAPPDAFSAIGPELGLPDLRLGAHGAATAMRGGRPAWRRWPNISTLSASTISSASSASGRFPYMPFTACWAISIPPCPTPPTNCAAWASIRPGGRFTVPGARRPDARRTVRRAGRRSAHDLHEGGPAAARLCDATQGRRARFPGRRSERQKPPARRADDAARRRAVHRGPAPQRFFPSPHRGPIDLHAYRTPRRRSARDTFDRLSRPTSFTAATTGSGRSRPCANSPCSSRRPRC